MLDISSFLDPHFKDANYFTLEDSIKDKIKEQMEELVLLSNPVVTQDTDASEQLPGSPPTRKKSWLTKILGPTVGETSSGLTPLQTVAKEFDQYFHYPKVDLETNPLEWWKPVLF